MRLYPENPKNPQVLFSDKTITSNTRRTENGFFSFSASVGL
jgi:hypothetical protein